MGLARLKCDGVQCYKPALCSFGGKNYCGDCYSVYYPPYFNIVNRKEISERNGYFSGIPKLMFSVENHNVEDGEEYGL